MLSVNIKNIFFENCIMNASGPKCTQLEELKDLNFSNSGAIVSKSATINYREGNEKPRYYDNNLGSINSMGLPNNGIQFYLNSAKYFNKTYIISISGLSLEENKTLLIQIFNYIYFNNHNIHGIEINLSCPNIKGKSQLAYSFDDLDNYLNDLFLVINKYKKTLDDDFIPIIGIKLPPYFELHHFEIVGSILNKYNIDFITTINSIPNGLIIDYKTENIVIKPKNGIGGIGGDYVKPTALSNVYNFYKVFKNLNSNIKIIGCGGIKNGADVFEYLLCGASLVQVGTHFYKEGTQCFSALCEELENLMKEKNYTNIDMFRGKLNNPY